MPSPALQACFSPTKKYLAIKLLDKGLACKCFPTSASMDTITAFCVQILGSIYHIPSRTCISRSIYIGKHKKVNLLSYWGKNCKNCHMCAICYIYSYITDSFHVAFFFLLDDRGSWIFLIR